MNPAVKRYVKKYGAMADAISRLDLEQTERELVASAIAAALDGQPDFRRDTFELTASDPLVACSGYGDTPCPNGREIRIGMHNSDEPLGRSAAWRPRKPTVRCVSCGSKHFREEVPA